MLKSPIIAILITMLAATAVLMSNSRTERMPGGTASANAQATRQTRVYYESPRRADAPSQTRADTRVLGRIDAISSEEAAAICRRTHQNDRGWRGRNCPPIIQTAHAAHYAGNP